MSLPLDLGNSLRIGTKLELIVIGIMVPRTEKVLNSLLAGWLAE